MSDVGVDEADAERELPAVRSGVEAPGQHDFVKMVGVVADPAERAVRRDGAGCMKRQRDRGGCVAEGGGEECRDEEIALAVEGPAGGAGFGVVERDFGSGRDGFEEGVKLVRGVGGQIGGIFDGECGEQGGAIGGQLREGGGRVVGRRIGGSGVTKVESYQVAGGRVEGQGRGG